MSIATGYSATAIRSVWVRHNMTTRAQREAWASRQPPLPAPELDEMECPFCGDVYEALPAAVPVPQVPDGRA